jgi:hypothetical protein
VSYGHTGHRCGDFIVAACVAMQGNQPKINPKANSLSSGSFVFDGVVYDNDIFSNKASSARYLSFENLSTAKYASLDSGATGHLLKSRPATSCLEDDNVVAQSSYMSATCKWFKCCHVWPTH